MLYVNKKLIVHSALFVKLKMKLHVFCSGTLTWQVWSQLRVFLEPNFTLPDLIPQAAIFGFPEELNCQSFVLFNHFLLLFQLKVYSPKTVQSYVLIIYYKISLKLRKLIKEKLTNLKQKQLSIRKNRELLMIKY